MLFIKRICIFLLLLITISCSKNNKEVKKDNLKALILGNSILEHSPAPEIGWYGNWGMAATAADSDFLHVYIRLLQESGKYNSIDISHKNIAVWEKNLSYDLTKFTDITSKTYDILIVRLGENVSDTANYKTALIQMINLFKAQNTKVIITGVIWENKVKENIHQQVAQEYGYKFLPFDIFRNNQSNYSWGLYENKGVASHPSNSGMQNIAQTLLNATLEFKP